MSKLTPVEFRGNELWGKEYCSIEELDISSIDRLLAIVKPVGNGDFSDEIKSFIVAAVNNHDRLTRERDELIKALESIAGYKGKTLLGPEWDTEHFYSQGANVAFEDCAGIARSALARVKGGKGDE